MEIEEMGGGYIEGEGVQVRIQLEDVRGKLKFGG